ncbi:MAG TPA: hypothetical protein VHC70_15470 [Phycisphaerales bacterium]|nr:hypothetical protein [Phycisphaerales bacterium]
MDFTDANSFLRQHWMEISGLFTLGVSLWIAFGPLRHRLPRLLTRLGKYSATLKLVLLSGGCWFLLYRCMTDDEPSLAINWMLAFLGIVLLAGAAFVVTRRQAGPRSAPGASGGQADAGPQARPTEPGAGAALRIRSACTPKARGAPAQP